MTPAEFARAMIAIAERPNTPSMGRFIEDTEMKHADADELLIEVLTGLGYEAGCEVFTAMRKRYA